MSNDQNTYSKGPRRLLIASFNVVSPVSTSLLPPSSRKRILGLIRLGKKERNLGYTPTTSFEEESIQFH